VRIIADLHIHSRYSRATSPDLVPPILEYWAARKGIGLLGTGDATHPAWLERLKSDLESAEEGLYRLKASSRLPEARYAKLVGGQAPRFVLTGEISTIYKAGGKTRKVHHLVILPGFEAADALQRRLGKVGNISSDGRPILGLDSRDLFEILLEADERSILVPAHIWTPWFSALGDKGGFDSIEECYRDLSGRIGAVETGLSSNPPMNWAVSSLDRYVLVSNSDAHSPENLAREATVMEGDLSYCGLHDALCGGGDGGRVAGTIEFFPEEGKYHYDGHRACRSVLSPAEAAASGELCPVCGKRVTVGVLHRVMELADRPLEESRPWTPADEGTKRRPYRSLVPLKELLGEILGVGPRSKRVEEAYGAALREDMSELDLLLEADPEEAGRRVKGFAPSELVSEALRRLREGKVDVEPGYDGEYGKVRLFSADEIALSSSQAVLFESGGNAPQGKSQSRSSKAEESAWAQELPLFARGGAGLEEAPAGEQRPYSPPELNAEQEAAASDGLEGRGEAVLVIAGPGAGKTALLVERVARLVESGVEPGSILALTFTNKAAAELSSRVARRLSGIADEAVASSTFHAFGASLEAFLKADEPAGEEDFLLSEAERDSLLCDIAQRFGLGARSAKRLGRYIESRKRLLLGPGEAGARGEPPAPGLPPLEEDAPLDAGLEGGYEAYEAALASLGARDFDALVFRPARLLASDPSLLAAARNRWRRLLVDEYQDVNYAQYALVRLLSGAPFAIGDPDQAIYGFRGADPRFIERFMEDYPGARLHRLTRSYRCKASVLAASGRLVSGRAGMPEEPGPGGDAGQGENGAVALRRIELSSDAAEAEWIARQIEGLVGGTSLFSLDSGVVSSARQGTASPGEVAILLRLAEEAPAIEKALRDHGIPFRGLGEKPWWDGDRFLPILGALRAAVEPRRASLLASTASPSSAVAGLGSLGACGKSALECVELALGLVPQGSLGPDERELLLEAASPYPSLSSFLAALSGGVEEGQSALTNDRVALMTIHASKGLEFPYVFIPGLEEGLIPFTRFDASPERLAEESRILYVGMTRAREGLCLSSARRRVLGGRPVELPPSSFLERIGSDLAQLVRSDEAKKRKDAQLDLF
jgi:superfamily I DNA/RNA helicase/PHP family Zn ribbon phosphoesterase